MCEVNHENYTIITVTSHLHQHHISNHHQQQQLQHQPRPHHHHAMEKSFHKISEQQLKKIKELKAKHHHEAGYILDLTVQYTDKNKDSNKLSEDALYIIYLWEVIKCKTLFLSVSRWFSQVFRQQRVWVCMRLHSPLSFLWNGTLNQ